MGYFSSASTVAMSIGPPLGIMLMGNKGFPNLFIGASINTLIALILIYFIQVPKIEMEVNREGFTSRLVEKKALFPAFFSFIIRIYLWWDY